jgi:hypothetical protein
MDDQGGSTKQYYATIKLRTSKIMDFSSKSNDTKRCNFLHIQSINSKLIGQGGESHTKEQFHQRNLKWLPKLGDQKLEAKHARDFF